MNEEDSRVIRPCPNLGGRIRVPGDKSMSHRAAMLTGLADGQSIIENFLVSEDCLNTLHAVGLLGAKVAREGTNVKVIGRMGMFDAPPREIDMGNSGTGMRLLAGILSGHTFVSRMTGDDSLLSRPMRRISEPLERMGVEMELLGQGGRGPIRIRGGALKGIWYQLPVASAQVKSCVLLAGLFAEGKTTVIEPNETRDHTERMLELMGADVEVEGLHVSVRGSGGEPIPLQAKNFVIPGDFSSAAYWIGAAAAREGAELVVEDVGLNPRRTAFLDVLKRMGAGVRIQKSVPGSGLDPNEWEPRGTVRVEGARLKGTAVGGGEIPNLIDELPLIAAIGSLAEGKTVIHDAAELRVKESDRIATTAAALDVLGVHVEEKPDGMTIEGGSSIKSGKEVDSCGDHRIAMAMAVLSLSAGGPVKVKNVSCIMTSYPGFWDDMEAVTRVRMV